MEVALLLLHKGSMAAISDNSVAAGVSVIRLTKDELSWCNKQGFVPLFKFYISSAAVGDFCCLADADNRYKSSQPSIPGIFSGNRFPSQSACHVP